jgi:hypothetical protein
LLGRRRAGHKDGMLNSKVNFAVTNRVRFVNIGDLASGAFCFFIGLHTFLSVVFDTRLSNLHFSLAIAFIWLTAYSLTIVGVAMHPEDIFVRAVSWCWMNSRYADLRLWLHYFWIFTFEFGTVLIYIAMFVALQYRIRSNFYSARGGAKQDAQARTAARLMIIYPIIYVICTLPLATLRMISMASSTMPSFGWFCFAGAMITSNGWLDVFLYSMTRRIMLFSDEPPPDNGIETFSMPFSGQTSNRFGNNTVCEYTGEGNGKRRGSLMPVRWIGRHNDIELGKSSAAVSMNNSTSQLFSYSGHSPALSQNSPKLPQDFSIAVKTSTTVEVKSELITEVEDVKEVRAMKENASVSTPPSSHDRSASERSDGMDDIEFATKPEGWP